MGFCGCTLQTNATVAAVFGMVQCIVDLIVSIVLVNKFNNLSNLKYDSSIYQWYKTLAGIYIPFAGIWLISSILLAVGIVKKNPVFHKQWTIVTSIVIGCGIVMFIIACTQIEDPPNIFLNNMDFMLLMNILLRWGGFSLIINIALAKFVFLRGMQIILESQPATHVIITGGQPGAVMQQTQMNMGVQGYGQNVYTMQATTPSYGIATYPKQTYGEIPLQQGIPVSANQQQPDYNKENKE